MNQEFLDVLQLNKMCVQKYFYDNINSDHSICDGYIIGYKKNNDDSDKNNWLKIRKTKLDHDAVKKELDRNNFKIIFIEKTNHINKCKKLVEILFTYAQVKRNNGNRTEEWFNIEHPIIVPNIIKSLIAMMNSNNITAPLVINQYIYTDNDTNSISESVKNESDDDDFLGIVAVGAVVTLIGGLLIGSKLVADTISKNGEIPSSIKKGVSGEILKLITFEDNEMPLYHYTSDKIHILLTDKRFIKIENHHTCSHVYLNQIKFVNHIKKSIFYYDKVEIIEDSGRVETFGIYEKSVCAYFVDLLNSIAKEIKDKKSQSENRPKQITTEQTEQTEKTDGSIIETAK